jgi:iron(III) transport system ATP-binding protein
VLGVPNLPLAREALAPAAGAAPVDATGVRKAFGATPVLHGVDLHVPAGQVVALLGPSGCGKTTLLRTLAGLERPDAGEVRVGERVLSGDGVFVPPEKRRVGMVFQDWALFPHLSVARNVGFGLTRAERRGGRIEEALALVELTVLGDRLPATLSGGQQQRVALARALATRPSVLLLDEPFSNLDTALRTSIRAEVHRLLRSLHVTTVFVTHDQEEAFVVGDEVAVMLAGEIAQQAPPAQLYDAPASRAVAEFVGDANLLAGVGVGDSADTLLGRLPLRQPLRGAVELVLRPEQVRVVPGASGVVEAVEYYGHDALYVVRPDGGPPVRARVLAAPTFAPGDRVGLGYAGGPVMAYARA